MAVIGSNLAFAMDFSNSSQEKWVRSVDVEPGHWKKQLPTKYLALAGQKDMAALKDLLVDHPDYMDTGGNHNRTFLWEPTRKGRLETVQ